MRFDWRMIAATTVLSAPIGYFALATAPADTASPPCQEERKKIANLEATIDELGIDDGIDLRFGIIKRDWEIEQLKKKLAQAQRGAPIETAALPPLQPIVRVVEPVKLKPCIPCKKRVPRVETHDDGIVRKFW